MRATKSICLNMVGEALSRLIFQLILVFGIAFMIAGFCFTYLAPGEEVKMLKDLGLTVVAIFGLLLAIYLAVSTIGPEVERRTIYCLMAKPVKRHWFYLGKFLGSMAILAISCLIMGLVLVFALYLKEQAWNWALLGAVSLTYIALVVVNALVMAISTFASPMLATVAGFTFWGLGYTQSYVHQLATHADNPTSRVMLEIMGVLIPDLQRFDLREAVVDLIHVPPSYVYLVTAYGLAYLVVMLAIGIIAFNQKQM